MTSPRFLIVAGLAACGGGPAPAAPASTPAHAHAHPAEGHFHHRFDDAERWAKVFDDPARDDWQKPAEVIAALALAPDARVADIGAGTGYFAMRLARQVPQGKVYAVDVEPDMVRHLDDRARTEALDNVVAILAADDDARLPEAVDLVLVVDTYHHIADRKAYFRRLAPSLRDGGRLAIIDFTPEAPMGPPVEHRISADQVITELGAAGYRLVARHDFLPNQYFLELAR
jgi:cyclopropane fatty-acyl-phospholipid synthase-like methyltransferase